MQHPGLSYYYQQATIHLMTKRIRFSEELATKVLEAFRRSPGNHCRVAREVGVDPRTAYRMWHSGYEHIPFLKEPMAEIIAKEQEEARARLHEMTTRADDLAATLEGQRRAEVKSKAAEDAAQSRVQEGQLIRLARGSTVMMLNTLTQINGGMTKVGAVIKQHLETTVAEAQAVDPATGKPKGMTTVEAMNITKAIQSLTTSMKQTVEAGAKVMEMERLYLGEPTSITQVNHLSDTMTQAEVDRRLLVAQRLVDRARRSGTLPAHWGADTVNNDTGAIVGVVDATLGDGLADTSTAGVPVLPPKAGV